MKVTTVLQAFIVAGLSSVAYIFFISDVIVKFQAGLKSFAKRQEEIESIECPAISFCFTPYFRQDVLSKYNASMIGFGFDIPDQSLSHWEFYEEATYLINRDFELKATTLYPFELHEDTVATLIEGINEINENGHTLQLNVSRLETFSFGMCYVITTSLAISSHSWIDLHIFPKDKDLEDVEVYLTSQSDFGRGLVMTAFFNAKPVKLQLEFSENRQASIDLHEIQERFLCTEEPKFSSTFSCHEEAVLRLIQNELSPASCVPLGYMGYFAKTRNTIERCETRADDSLMKMYIMSNYSSILKQCTKLCNSTRYSAEITKRRQAIKNVGIMLHSTSVTKTIIEEYLVYDLPGMFGNIGGTLGLFLGVSLFSLLSKLITTMCVPNQPKPQHV